MPNAQAVAALDGARLRAQAAQGPGGVDGARVPEGDLVEEGGGVVGPAEIQRQRGGGVGGVGPAGPALEGREGALADGQRLRRGARAPGGPPRAMSWVRSARGVASASSARSLRIARTRS